MGQPLRRHAGGGLLVEDALEQWRRWLCGARGARTTTAPWWSAASASATSTPKRRSVSRPRSATACTCTRSSPTTARRCACTASPRSANKERAIVERFASRFETALTQFCEGLARPRTEKRASKIRERIGRIKAKSRSIAQHYRVALDTDPTGERATAIRFTREPVEGLMMTHPGVYCLRSNQTEWDEETLWRAYVTLTDIEAVFRSLKSELGLRPIFHHKPIRAEGHLFITVIAYQLVQVIRQRLRQHRESASWDTVRRILEGHQRITATFRRADGRTLHVRKATRAEPPQQAIYDALGVDPEPGGIRKTIV